MSDGKCYRPLYWPLLIIYKTTLRFLSIHLKDAEEKNQYPRDLAMKMAFMLALAVLLLCRAKRALSVSAM